MSAPGPTHGSATTSRALHPVHSDRCRLSRRPKASPLSGAYDQRMTHQLDFNERLDGVRVAITGGTSGLGLALVDELTRRGARVAFVARTRERVEEVARSHPGAYGIVGDVARKEDIHPIALQIIGSLGGLDVLVNNASSLGPAPLALLADTECEDLELALATNVLGPFRLTKALLGALASSARAGRHPQVINVSSDAA